MTVEEKIKLLEKPLLTKKAMMELIGCGYARVNRIREQIATSSGYLLSERTPTKLVIDHLHIDVDLLIKLAKESP